MKRSVYLGTEGAQELAAHVLKASIEFHSRGTVEVKFLNREMRSAGFEVNNTVNSNTPFSKQRVYVPKLAGSGQAAYLDSDMIVFRDINELFDYAGSTAIASCATRQRLREAQTSVTLFDVAQCQWDPRKIISEIDADPNKYRPYLYEFAFAGGTQHNLPANWNDLEDYEPGSTCLVHFTDMETQPWLSITNRNADVWLDALRAAVESGKVDVRIVEESVRDFQIRPSLLWQVKNQWRSTSRIPFLQRLNDILFYVPPHSLEGGIPLGLGRLATRIVQSSAPRFVKKAVLLVCGTVLLARKRRRLLVKGALLNKKCLINRFVETVLDERTPDQDVFSHIRA